MNDNGYGLWFLVVFNAALFILFAVASSTRRASATGG